MDAPRDAVRHHYHHHHNVPRIVPLHPANNGRVWLMVLAVLVIGLLVIGLLVKGSATVKADTPATTTVTAPFVPPTDKPPVKADAPSPTPIPTKASGNTKGNNVNVEGTSNTVHIGDNITYTTNTTIVVVQATSRKRQTRLA